MKRLPLVAISTVLAVLVLARCTDDFLQKTNQNSINSDVFYQNEEQALASVNSAYALLQARGLWGRSIFFILDFAGQEVDPTANTQAPPAELLNHTYGPEGNEHIDLAWPNLYDMVSKANSTILNVGGMDEEAIDSGLQSRIVAEAKFLRGLGYFYINAMYGGGPLRTVENLDEMHTPRASAEEIWSQVETDLNDAASELPWEYDGSNVGRATAGAAFSLLGRAHLYQEEFGDAETAFQEVIDRGVYDLVKASDYGGDPVAAMRSNHSPDVDNNQETVFEVQFMEETGFGWSSDGTGRNESSIRPQEYGVDGNAFYNAVPAADLIDAYDEDDPRLEAFYFGPNSTYQGEPYDFENLGWAWKKYQKTDEPENNASDANMDVIRYADVLLMMAEAKIRGGSDVPGGIELINDIRERADPSSDILEPRDTGASQSQAFDWLVLERRLELAGEQTRFFDMVRWDMAADAWSSFEEGKHEVFPIPQSEINANTEMDSDDQNPGYR